MEIVLPQLPPTSKPVLQTEVPTVLTRKIITGLHKEWIELCIRLSIFRVAFRIVSHPLQLLKVMRQMDNNRRKFSGPSRIKKIIKVDGRYYWDLYIPGWRAKAFDRFVAGEVKRIHPNDRAGNRFNNIFIAITKKCPLQCEHCFEWDNLNKKERLEEEDLKQIVGRFGKLGTGQFQITGGEPLLRMNEIESLIRVSNKESDFWILTSGFNLTMANALRLKKAGCTGIVISLDHFDPTLHNIFRGFDSAYQWVEHAVQNANAAKLVTALSICVTRNFISEENLMTYMELAKKMGISFVQILEPKAVGHYAGKDVQLTTEHQKMLEEFCFRLNYNKRFRDYPVITYHGYYQRKIGCLSGGNRNLYIDTDGDLHACPFCQTKMGSALDANLEDHLQALQNRGCHSFSNAGF